MGLRDFARVFSRSWYIIVGLSLLGLLAGGSIAYLTTPKYEATTQMYVSVRSEAITTGGDLVQGSAFARQIVQSYVNIVSTSLVLEPVIDDLDLDVTVAELAEQISATAPTNTVIINITATDTNARQAARLANGAARSFTHAVQNTLERPQRLDTTSLVQITVVEPATTPQTPSTPNWPLNLIAGLFAGFALGLAIAVLRQALDTRLRSIHDLEQATDAPVLGGIPRAPAAAKRGLILQSAPHSPLAEPFRSLRTNLQFLNVEDGPRSFVISSAGSSEGKSTLAANLALSIAETGQRVALVDGDLRAPRIGQLLDLEDATGLTDVLIGRVTLADALQRYGDNELFALPAGPIPPNPSELLGSAMMDNVLAALTEYFDYVLIDSPPIALVTDAAVLGKKSRGVILVAAAGKTRRPALVGAIRAVSAAGATLLGAVMTLLPPKGAEGYGYGYGKTRKSNAKTQDEEGAELTRAALRANRTVTPPPTPARTK